MIACFYMPSLGIACERARVPYLADEPLALASREAVITSVSAQAASAGISAGMTLTAARSLCHDLVILPYNRQVYAEAAEAVWDALATESDCVEPVSPEMVFIALPHPDALDQSKRLAQMLSDRLNIRITIGVGSSKLVAMHAAMRTFGKELPVLTVMPGTEAVFLASLPIACLELITPETKSKLEKLGVKNLGDVLRLPNNALRYQFKNIAELLRRLAVGEDGECVKALWPPAAICRTITFDEDTESKEQLHRGLHAAAAYVAEMLASEQTYCSSVTLIVTLADGSEIVTRGELKRPANSSTALFAAAKRLLERIALDRAVNAMTLKASSIDSGSAAQLTLFDASTQEEIVSKRMKNIEAALHFVKARYGIASIVLASLLYQARAIDLKVLPLAHRKKEHVQVAVNAVGAPVRIYRDDRASAETLCADVTSIYDQWKKTSWSWDAILETSCWRVVTEPFGIHQLERLGVEWTLTASAD